MVDLKPEVDRLEKSQSSLRAELGNVRHELDAAKAEAAHLREHAPVDGEHERLERALAQHSAELTRVRGERAKLEQAVRELTMSLAQAHQNGPRRRGRRAPFAALCDGLGARRPRRSRRGPRG